MWRVNERVDVHCTVIGIGVLLRREEASVVQSCSSDEAQSAGLPLHNGSLHGCCESDGLGRRGEERGGGGGEERRAERWGGGGVT